MQRKNVCKRCKHLDVAQGYGNFNHYCELSFRLLGDDEINNHTCSNFKLKQSSRAEVSIFKYVLDSDGKYIRYYLSDEEVLQLFERRQNTVTTAAVSRCRQKSRSTL